MLLPQPLHQWQFLERLPTFQGLHCRLFRMFDKGVARLRIVSCAECKKDEDALRRVWESVEGSGSYLSSGAAQCWLEILCAVETTRWGHLHTILFTTATALPTRQPSSKKKLSSGLTLLHGIQRSSRFRGNRGSISAANTRNLKAVMSS